MKIFVIGAGQVGTTIVQALHDEHDVTVIDLDPARLEPLAHRYDVSTIEGNGASRRVLAEAGVATADLLIACTSRDEANIVAAMISKAVAPRTTTIVRTTNPEYLEVWREGQLDVDFIVSSEVETANAISRSIGVPAARQTDVFADGQVHLVEFDVDGELEPDRGRRAGARGAAAEGLEDRRHHPRRVDDLAGRKRGRPRGRPDRRDRLSNRGAGLGRADRAGLRQGDATSSSSAPAAPAPRSRRCCSSRASASG